MAAKIALLKKSSQKNVILLSRENTGVLPYKEAENIPFNLKCIITAQGDELRIYTTVCTIHSR